MARITGTSGGAGLSQTLEAVRQSPAYDAFARARTAEPKTLFASSMQYNELPLVWQSKLTAGGTATFLPNEAAVRMRVLAEGDAVIRQTYRYMRYLPGKSQLILVTGVLGAQVAHVTKRVGYFDAQNGLFFQQDGEDGLAVVRRTYVTGTAVDHAVARADWNIDPMDGTGPSGVTLDVTKPFIGVIDFEWLGIGRVRWGFNIDGMTYYVHENLWANRGDFAGVYMTTANLPVRYEIQAVGGPIGSSPVDLMQVCSTVVSEGGSDMEQLARIRAANNATTPISVSTRRAILSVRPKATFNSLVNRAHIVPLSVEFINTGNAAVLVEVVRGGTLGGSPSWVSAGTTSTVESDVAGTTVTGGEVLWSGYVANANQGGRLALPLEGLSNADLPLTLDIDGANPVNLSVVVTSLGAATACASAITWREVY